MTDFGERIRHYRQAQKMDFSDLATRADVDASRYNEMRADRRCIPLQLRGFVACGDAQVPDVVRHSFGRIWQTVAESTGLDPVTIKAFLALGMLLKHGAAARSSSWTTRGPE
jgi:hypothetical protein